MKTLVRMFPAYGLRTWSITITILSEKILRTIFDKWKHPVLMPVTVQDV